jgi:hypothetical protein
MWKTRDLFNQRKNLQTETMEQYFAVVTEDYLTAKNQLHKDIKDMVKSYDRWLLPSNELLDRYLRLLESGNELMHSINPRCNPVKISISDGFKSDKRMIVRFPGVCAITIWKIAQII